jgi:hypothetical protein
MKKIIKHYPMTDRHPIIHDVILVIMSVSTFITAFILSSSDNKSVSHWIMFDYFFHVWKVNIFFFLIMFLIFLNLVYFLSLVGLWQNHVLYWTLTDFIWRHTTPFGKGRVNKYGSVCNYYRSLDRHILVKQLMTDFNLF